jgi:hypothetical protein
VSTWWDTRSVAESDTRIGTQIAGYRLEAVLGRGGMGVVYLAADLRLGRAVAVKLLAPELAADQTLVERFLRESRIAASIDHPHVIPVYEAGEDEGVLFIAMRYVDGSDLRHMLLRDGRLPPERAVQLLRQIASGLGAAHQRGLVHRDVKPGNILVARSADGDHTYLSDFGLSKQRDSSTSLTGSSSLLGTVDYMAPEQLRGDDVDGRADIYALGCTFYQCLAGTTPFPGNEVAVLLAHLERPPPTLPRDLGLDRLDGAIARALAKNPNDRQQTAGEFAAEVSAALGDAGGSKVRRRRPRLRSLGAVVVVAGFIFAGALLMIGAHHATRRQQEPPFAPVGIAKVDASTGKIATFLRLSKPPTRLAAYKDYLWVGDGHTVTAYRIADDRPVASHVGVAFGLQSGVVYIVDAGGRVSTVSADPSLATVGGSPGPGDPPLSPYTSVEVLDGNVFVGTRGGLATYGLGISYGHEPLGGHSNGFTKCGGGLWILTKNSHGLVQVLRASSGSAAVSQTFAQGNEFTIMCGETAVWIASSANGQVVSIPVDNPSSVRQAVKPVDHATALSSSAGIVWIADGVGRKLVALDETIASRVVSISLPGYPTAVAAAGRYTVWVGYRASPFR